MLLRSLWKSCVCRWQIYYRSWCYAKGSKASYVVGRKKTEALSSSLKGQWVQLGSEGIDELMGTSGEHIPTEWQRKKCPGVLKCGLSLQNYNCNLPRLQKISLQKPYVGFLASRTRSFKESLGKRTMWLFFLSERHQEFHAWMHGRAPLEAKEALQPQTDRLNSVGSRPGGGCATQGLWKLQHLHLSWD